jgi:hypothetical protein
VPVGSDLLALPRKPWLAKQVKEKIAKEVVKCPPICGTQHPVANHDKLVVAHLRGNDGAA